MGYTKRYLELYYCKIFILYIRVSLLKIILFHPLKDIGQINNFLNLDTIFIHNRNTNEKKRISIIRASVITPLYM